MERPITSLDISAERLTVFEREWIEAWSAHDIDRILSHYRDDVRFVSPVAARVGVPQGRVHGLDALRAYFERGLAMYPTLHFSASQRSLACAVRRAPCAAVLGCAYGLCLVFGLTEVGRLARPEAVGSLTAVYYAPRDKSGIALQAAGRGR